MTEAWKKINSIVNLLKKTKSRKDGVLTLNIYNTYYTYITHLFYLHEIS